MTRDDVIQKCRDRRRRLPAAWLQVQPWTFDEYRANKEKGWNLLLFREDKDEYMELKVPSQAGDLRGVLYKAREWAALLRVSAFVIVRRSLQPDVYVRITQKLVVRKSLRGYLQQVERTSASADTE